MTKVQRYKVGYYTDEWGMSIISPCLIPDGSGFAVKFEDYCKLETELAALKTGHEWRDIETAPKDGTVFLGYKLGQFRECYKVPRDDCDMWCFGGTSGADDLFPNIKPTHWMPLPKPPARYATILQGEQ